MRPCARRRIGPEDRRDRVIGLRRDFFAHALKRVGHAHAGDNRVVPRRRGLEEPINQFYRHARSRSIVYRNVRGRVGHQRQRVADALVTVHCAALAHLHPEQAEFVGMARGKLRKRRGIGRPGDDHMRHEVVLGEQLDRAVQDRPPAQVLIEFAPLRPKRLALLIAARTPRGRNDDGDLHA